jgi:hypothetical protein
LLEHLEETVETLVQSGCGRKVDEPDQPISCNQPLPEGAATGLGVTPKSRRSRLLTLLLLSAYGVRRPRDLRSYSGAALGLLSLRKRAYGYWCVERFLSHLSYGNGAESLTTMLGTWTAKLWQQEKGPSDDFYVDGHHKPVYSQQLVPRGLIGRSGKILGCRGLMLLHDHHGHPRLVLTGRGDWHVMEGLTELVSRYEQITKAPLQRRIVVDREGMGAAFLQKRKQERQVVVTLLRSNQYQGIESFSEVGAFVPLTHDAHGRITREVAPARFTLSLPDGTGESLEVAVALIRDHRAALLHSSGSFDDQTDQEDGLQESESLRAPRLIPIITTDSAPIGALALAESYIHRWAAQENVIKDYLLPLGLDINHGFSKAPVVNSEVTKKRETFQKHLDTFKKWMESAHVKYHQIRDSQVKLLERIKRNEQQFYLLCNKIENLDENSYNYSKYYKKLQKKIGVVVIQQEKRKARLPKLSGHLTELQEKIQQHKQKQCDLLRSLEKLERNERTMYELDNRKDHVMTIFKVALTNLAMWTRDQYFPASYSNATWDRLAPFFRLPGIVRSSRQTVEVELRPFNDRQYNRDLHLLCQLVNQKQPHLPDGRLLTFSVWTANRPVLDEQVPRLA